MSSSRTMISVGLGGGFLAASKCIEFVGGFLAASKGIEFGGACQEESQGIELEVAF